jgi:hypothetical protein
MNVYNNEGVEYAKPKPKVMGLEMIKSSTPAYCRKIMWEAIDVVLNGNEDKLIGMIEAWKDEFRTQNIVDIAFPRGVNGLKKFSDPQRVFGKGTPIHVRGSLLYNNMIMRRKLDKTYPLIQEGEKIKFIFLKEPNTIQSDIIAFPTIMPKELELDQYIDYDTQFEKSFIDPLRIVLDSIGWKTEQVSSLEDFFS